MEGYHAREGGVDAVSIAPACGVGAGIELGLEFVRSRPVVEDRGGWGAQVKLDLPALKLGGVDFGAKVAAFTARNGVVHDSRPRLWTATGLATTRLADPLVLHLNLGAAWLRPERRTVAVYGAALQYDFGERAFVFAELTGTHDTGAFRNTGLRWWLVPERLGVDLTVGRRAGTRDSTLVTIGLAGYGIGAFD